MITILEEIETQTEIIEKQQDLIRKLSLKLLEYLTIDEIKSITESEVNP